MTKLAPQTELPRYDNPPVVETVVGVQFRPIPGFTNAHLGAFWQALGQQGWPLVADMPQLPRQEERFSPEGQWGRRIQLQLTQDPSARVQMRNSEGNRMVQLQNGRLHLNWLGKGGDKYPQYDRVRSDFQTCLNRLLQFVDDQGLGTVEPDQWEVTYVNHIPQSTVWNSPADWSFFKPLNAVPSVDGLIEAESFSGEWHFVIPDKRGRLHIKWQHAIDAEQEPAEMIRLDLTARGPVKQSADLESSILNGIDLGHETIVGSFKVLMSDPANKEWKLNDDGSS
ncbi:MAG: TIGR04255 family protein [Rhodopirellula sp.]|nr:TIGR04255 family protein [Rhodopirellula sp.]